MKWNYTVNKGLSYSNDSNLRLSFGMTRDTVRKMLSYDRKKNRGRSDNEDSYENLFGLQNHWIRLGFENDLLFEIEVLDGIVLFDEVIIQTDTGLANTLAQLRAKGHIFEEWDYGYLNRISKIDLGDSEKNGGISNLVRWILVSENLNHIT